MPTGRQVIRCCLLYLSLLVLPPFCRADTSPVVLSADTAIYTTAKLGEPLYRAVKALQRDIRKVVGVDVSVRPLAEANAPGIVIRGPADGGRITAGPESHHLYVTAVDGRPQLVLEGADVRGEIYAIYTFSERVLGVPPFWYYSAWTPGRPRPITVPATFDVSVPSPQVRYRAWFPNDTDLFAPWRKLSADNSEMWLEAALRLKLNTVEWFDGERDYAVPYSVSPTTQLISGYGLINTTHHHSPLNASFEGWDDYWTQVRKTTPPALSLANEKAVTEFWQYNVDCVVRHKIDMLWVIGFRGRGDHPFWNTFKDAPASMQDRGEVIGHMMDVQRDLVIRTTGNPATQFRTIFYNELSDLLAQGYIHPPDDPALIWTYVAARRDHYPNTDVQQLADGTDRNLGYYFNCQFTSTGSHLATAEGPWKMEQNLRYVAGKSGKPLAFSVVNAGNIREYVMELSAHAAMLWDFKAYSTDDFLRTFCATYYGSDHAARAAALYKAYYEAFWQQKRPDLTEINRQYIFQDLRYQKAILDICGDWKKKYNPNPLKDAEGEQEKGRTFRIVPEDNAATTQVDATINGTGRSADAFGRVAKDADALYATLGDEQRPFFNDNLRQPAYYMYNLNVRLLQLSKAYGTTDTAARLEGAKAAAEAMKEAEAALKSTQHGPFATWYAGDKVFGFKGVREKLERIAAGN
jgi:hypothetical protein